MLARVAVFTDELLDPLGIDRSRAYVDDSDPVGAKLVCQRLGQADHAEAERIGQE